MVMNRRKAVYVVRAWKNLAARLTSYSIYSASILRLGPVLNCFIYIVPKRILPEHGGVFGMPDEGENIQLHIIDYT